MTRNTGVREALRGVRRLAYLIAGCLLLATGAAAGGELAEVDREYWAARQRLDADYRQQLAELAARCVQLDLPQQAAATSGWFIARDPRRQYLFLPPADARGTAAGQPRIVEQWQDRFLQLRRRQAEQLFAAARQQLQRERSARAYQLLHEVLYEDPDHAAARRALGYRLAGGRWTRPTSTIRSRQVRGENAAWGLSGTHWIIESEHFRIATNHSPAAGRELAERLETLHTVWSQLFFRYWSSPAALARQIEGQGEPPRGSPRHQVVLYRDRPQYLAHLQRSERLIELTIGIYLDAPKTAYFYVDAQADAEVFYHEVTHQLFSETGQVAPGTGAGGNAWILEGVALYMESLRRREGYCTVGGVDASRLQYARYRLLSDDYYVPLAQLVALGRRGLQEHPDIRRLYSQAAGLTAMLMDHQRGAYREPLVEYLGAVYSGRARQETLAALTGTPLAELDARYRQFLDVTDEDLAHLAAAPDAKELSLGHTAVTDQGLRHLAGHAQLRWLDLAATAITDAGFASLRRAELLNHLILERTALGDPSLDVIAGFRDLEILDLTGTAISDQGLARLAGLSKLRELWLGDTGISDSGLEHLRGLTKLQVLDVGGTRVTAEGWQRLRTALPGLQP